MRKLVHESLGRPAISQESLRHARCSRQRDVEQHTVREPARRAQPGQWSCTLIGSGVGALVDSAIPEACSKALAARGSAREAAGPHRALAAASATEVLAGSGNARRTRAWVIVPSSATRTCLMHRRFGAQLRQLGLGRASNHRAGGDGGPGCRGRVDDRVRSSHGRARDNCRSAATPAASVEARVFARGGAAVEVLVDAWQHSDAAGRVQFCRRVSAATRRERQRGRHARRRRKRFAR